MRMSPQNPRLNKKKVISAEQLFLKNRHSAMKHDRMWENVSLFVGQCLCGQCTCHPPGDSRVHGKNCECDDRQCEDINGEVCGGESAQTHTHTHTHIPWIFESIKDCSSRMSNKGNWWNTAVKTWKVWASTSWSKLDGVEQRSYSRHPRFQM